MQLSILTPTYNRGNLLKRIYESLIKNSNYDLRFEWLIMDDGSTDNTKEIVDNFIKEKKINIKYYYQENQGKAVAINNLLNYAAGEFIIDCDSDDYFASNAFKIIKDKVDILRNSSKLYAAVFLKCDMSGEVSGKRFKEDKYITTMFELYFKDDIQGEKIILFKSDIRKKYRHELEKNEKFVTESRMYHKMDLKYKVVCFNIPLIIGDYRKDGYTSNIDKVFIKNPLGYCRYFEEILNYFDLKDVKLNKRLYLIKHYILFSYLSKNNNIIKKIKGRFNKFLLAILYIPGYLFSWKYKKKYTKNIEDINN